MGIPDLMSFMSLMNLVHRSVSIADRVETWKRKNPEETPIIVIDFADIIHHVWFMRNHKLDAICGGRPKEILQSFQNVLNNLATTGCKLVFFADLNTPESKAKTWMERQDNLFKIYKKFFASINNEKSIYDILDQNPFIKMLKSAYHDMAAMAQQYGEFVYSTKQENDVLLAKYATQHNALAIISSDSDYLIFDGLWLFWSVKNEDLSQLQVTEYDRNGLLKVLNLSRSKMSLFASLVGNDFTKGLLPKDFKNAAQYLRGITVGMSNNLSSDIQCIAECIFERENINQQMRTSMLASLESYNLDFETTIDDPLEQKLLKTNNPVYSSYMAITSKVQGISLPYYDMEHRYESINLTNLIIIWSTRKAGFLLKHKNYDESYKITFLAKTDKNQKFEAHEKAPAYPEIPVSRKLLDELYCGKDTLDGIEFKWVTLGKIMSFSNDEISKLKQLPKQMRLTVAILIDLVKRNLLTTQEADGILCTETLGEFYDLGTFQHPNSLLAWNVRAAHTYILVFPHVRENFAIAGLLSEINAKIQFDGVYYQTIMYAIQLVSDDDLQKFISPIQKYRLYSNLA